MVLLLCSAAYLLELWSEEQLRKALQRLPALLGQITRPFLISRSMLFPCLESWVAALPNATAHFRARETFGYLFLVLGSRRITQHS